VASLSVRQRIKVGDRPWGVAIVSEQGGATAHALEPPPGRRK
jgi:hypothetical protein